MVLFESEQIIALEKPAGLSMATPRSDPSAEARVVRALLEAAGERRDADALRLIHRLDLGTSGVVLLAKGAEAHRALSRALAERRLEKRYRALVWGRPEPPEGLWEDPLARDRRDGRRMEARAEGKPSRTRYRLLASGGPASDLRISPETGRTHQIRVHCAAHGHPILGDDLYGGAALWQRVADPAHRRALAAISRPLLHAESIALPEAGLTASSPLPTDYLRALEALEIPPQGVGNTSPAPR